MFEPDKQKPLTMKLLLLLALMTLFILPAFSQSTDTSPYVLGVNKQYKNHTRQIIFKSGSLLNIKTKQGDEFFSRNYTFSDQMIVLDAKDSIRLDDIEWIMGRVHGNAGLKVLGVLMILYSVEATIPVLVGFMLADASLVALGTAAVGVSSISGISLLGPRKFRSSNKWQVKLIEQDER